MITAVDTNVLIALWDSDDALNTVALSALTTAHSSGKLVIFGAVYCELLAFPSRSERFLSKFLADTRITVDWSVGEDTWKLAGKAFAEYAKRRRKQTAAGPRRILADFLIGAHAAGNGHSFLTLDDRIYRAAFPKLRIVKV